MIKAYAAFEAGGELKPFEYDPGPLGQNDVEIDVEHCGICHSDLSMLDNEWGMTQYPFVPGHEVVGTIAAVGREVTNLECGERVGLGWHAGYCMTCPSCAAKCVANLAVLTRSFSVSSEALRAVAPSLAIASTRRLALQSKAVSLAPHGSVRSPTAE